MRSLDTKATTELWPELSEIAYRVRLGRDMAYHCTRCQVPSPKKASLLAYNPWFVGTCRHWYPQGSNVKQRKSVLVGYPRL